jgi:phospholipid transport system substrate-binding protein
MMRGRVAVLLTTVPLLTTLLLLVAARTARAAGPAEALRHQIDRVLATLRDPELRRAGASAERRLAVRAIAEETFDFAETARRALGRHWQQRSAPEREEFVRLFTEMLERAYVSKLDLWDGEAVVLSAESVEGDQAVVRVHVVGRQGSEVPVDCRLLQDEGGRWRVWDVDIGGVSIVANYRAQFNKVIRTSSFDGLLARLRAKETSATNGP